MASRKPSAKRIRVLIVDDEAAMGHILVKSLEADGLEAVSYTSPTEALEAIPAEQPDVIVTDVRMPEMTGRDLLTRLTDEYPEIPVLVMTAFGTIEDAVEMLKSGAFNYLTKPFQHATLLHLIQQASVQRRLMQENIRLSQPVSPVDDGRLIIGQSRSLGEVRHLIERAAQTDSTVLVTGESGVGKELVAREIHRLSGRADKRFVAVNCPAIPVNLIESELFGFERGAFTGANEPKMGLIELSGGGTLFLDEIGELPLAVQAKLLRVIQEREILRLGALRPSPVDLRIVAATNRVLENEVKSKNFREDLFYRLKVVTIDVPPLRERRDDIPELAKHFLERIGRRNGRPGLTINEDVVQKLQRHDWPGNIRELENSLERMTAMSPATEFTLDDLPADFAESQIATDDTSSPAEIRWPIDFKEAREVFEKSYFDQIIKESGGNMTKAARLSGISRRHLYEKMDKLGIDRDQTKADF